jgi:hypothetical protein
MLLHTDAFTHTKKNTFTHRPFHRPNSKKPSVFHTGASFRAKGLPRTLRNRNLTARNGCRRTNQSHKKPSVSDDGTWFRAKGLSPRVLNRNFTSVFDERTWFRAKGLRPTLQTRNLTAVFDDRTWFRAKGLPPTLQTRNLTSVFDDGTSFRAKGLPRKRANRNFISVFDEDVKSQFYFSFWRLNMIEPHFVRKVIGGTAQWGLLQVRRHFVIEIEKNMR